MRKALLYGLFLFILIQVILLTNPQYTPRDEDLVMPEVELNYDPWETDKKRILTPPKPNPKADTTPYKGNWVDIN